MPAGGRVLKLVLAGGAVYLGVKAVHAHQHQALGLQEELQGLRKEVAGA